MVLLHGWGMNRGHMGALAAELATRWRIHCLDLPGHGEDADRLPEALEDVLARLVDAAPRRAVWVGWSLGGALALRIAQRYPERVERLVLLATNPRFVACDNWPVAMSPTRFEDFADGLGADPVATLRRFVALQFLGETNSRAAALSAQRLVEAAPPSVAGLEAGLCWLREWDLRPALRELATPVQAIFGGRDRVVPPAVANAIRALRPASRVLVVETAGHAPGLTHPAVTARHIMEYADV